MAPISSDSSVVRSVTWSAVISPFSSLLTTSASTIFTNSCSRSRSSSAAILPVKFGSANPSTSICTGPIAIVSWSPLSSRAGEQLLLLHVEFRLREDALVEQLLQVLELGHHVVATGRGSRGGGRRGSVLLRRRRVLLLRLLCLEVRDLLVLRLLGSLVLGPPLARVVRDAADNGCASERPSSHTH